MGLFSKKKRPALDAGSTAEPSRAQVTPSEKSEGNVPPAAHVEDDEEESGTPYNNADRIGIRLEGRRCTDILFLLVFLSFWIGMLALAYYAFDKGDPVTLYLPQDYTGNVCGRNNIADGTVGDIFDPLDTVNCGTSATDDEAAGTGRYDPACFAASARDFSDKPYIAYFSSYSASDIRTYGGVCVSYCPGEGPVGSTTCPLGNGVRETTENSSICNILRYDNSSTLLGSLEVTYPGGGGLLPKSNSLFYRCVPACSNDCDTVFTSVGVSGDIASAVANFLEDPESSLERAVSYIWRSWKIVLICAGIGIFLAFFWILLLRLIAGLFVWLTVWGLAGLFFGLAWYCDHKASEISAIDAAYGVSDSNHKWYVAGAWAAGIAGVIYLLIVVAMRNRLRIAVGVMNETSAAVYFMPWIVFFPIVSQLLILLVVGYCAFVFTGLYSIGTYERPSVAGGEVDFTPDDKFLYLVLYDLFGFLWSIGFVSALSYMTLAGAFATWYWTKPPKNRKNIPKSPIWSSFKRTLRYHTGTIAFGTFIIAVIQMIRLAMKYLEKYMRAQTGDQSKWLKWLFWVIHCCLWCFERFIRFLNKMAYIHTAVFGTNFCSSAKSAFFLLLRNIARISIVSWITDFLLFVGRLSTAAACVLIGWALLENGELVTDSGGSNDGTEVDSTQFDFQIFPLVLIGFTTYFLAKMILGVYETGVDTILISFCEDKERNKTTGEYYCTQRLGKFMKTVKKSKRSPKEKELEKQVKALQAQLDSARH